MTDNTVQLNRQQALLLLNDGELGVAEWNEHYGVGHATRDLSGVDLSGAMLRNVRLSGTDLSGATLKAADLYAASLEGAELGDADLREAHLGDANLCEAGLIQANLNLANLAGAKLARAKLSYATFVRTNLVGADVSGANLNRSDLSGADLAGARLVAAKLGAADLSQVNLQGADLTGADLSEADLGGANLRRANLRGTNLESTNLEGAVLDEACVDGARFVRTRFDNDFDLLLLDWDFIEFESKRYDRLSVERGDQTLPRSQLPLKIRFALGSQVTDGDLRALQSFVTSEAKPKGTNLYLALTESGAELVVEGRGKLTQAGLVGAMLFSLANQDGAGNHQQTSADKEPPNPLARSLARASSPDLLACAKKLNHMYVRPRAEPELRRFQELIEKYDAGGDAKVSGQMVTLIGRSQATRQILLRGLGFEANDS